MEHTNATTGMSVPPQLRAAIETLEEAEAIDGLFEPLERLTAPVASGKSASVLQGEWLGHALHPLLTDFPLGCWMSAGVLDLFGGRGSRKSAQRLVGFGLLAVPVTAASGWSDWSTLRDPRTRRVGVVHGIGNSIVALLYFRSWRARRRGKHMRGVAYALLGGTGAWVTGYLGGHLSFARQAGVGERGLDDPHRVDPHRVDSHGVDSHGVDSHGVDSQRAEVRGPIDVDAGTDELIDLTRASELIGVPIEQAQAMVDEGLLAPASYDPEPRFRDSDVRAVRMLGG